MGQAGAAAGLVQLEQALKHKGFQQLRKEWLQHFMTTRGAGATADAAYSLLLNTDLRCAAGVVEGGRPVPLPPRSNVLKDAVLQINDAEEVGISALSLLSSLEALATGKRAEDKCDGGENDGAGPEDTEYGGTGGHKAAHGKAAGKKTATAAGARPGNPRQDASVEARSYAAVADPVVYTREGIPRRALKLKLTDGCHELVAFEHEVVVGISILTPPGTKIHVTNAQIVNGVILLKPRNVRIVGGVVSEMNLLENPLHSYISRLKQKLKLSDDSPSRFKPPPHSIDPLATQFLLNPPNANDFEEISIGHPLEQPPGNFQTLGHTPNIQLVDTPQSNRQTFSLSANREFNYSAVDPPKQRQFSSNQFALSSVPSFSFQPDAKRASENEKTESRPVFSNTHIEPSNTRFSSNFPHQVSTSAGVEKKVLEHSDLSDDFWEEAKRVADEACDRFMHSSNYGVAVTDPPSDRVVAENLARIEQLNYSSKVTQAEPQSNNKNNLILVDSDEFDNIPYFDDSSHFFTREPRIPQLTVSELEDCTERIVDVTARFSKEGAVIRNKCGSPDVMEAVLRLEDSTGKIEILIDIPELNNFLDVASLVATRDPRFLSDFKRTMRRLSGKRHRLEKLIANTYQGVTSNVLLWKYISSA